MSNYHSDHPHPFHPINKHSHPTKSKTGDPKGLPSLC